MISSSKIRLKARRKYYDVLSAILKNEQIFPLVIPGDKRLPDEIDRLRRELDDVIGNSKDRLGYGYLIHTEPRKTRNHGYQDVPVQVMFETEQDYFRYLNKQKEVDQARDDFAMITKQYPDLGIFLCTKPNLLIENNGRWEGLMLVCNWFTSEHEPGKYYIREMPIPVHTKFIEQHKGVLRQLLDWLLPADRLVSDANNFEQRFGLKTSPAMVRFRRLDANCWPYSEYSEMIVPLNEFASNTQTCKRVFFVENLMNYLTFPEVASSVVIWSKGFAIEAFKQVSWLHEKELYYWSDLDAQGFQMLSQLRGYFPHTESIFMDMNTLESYSEFIVSGTPTSLSEIPSLLNNDERAVYMALQEGNLRLEQERIPHDVVCIALVNNVRMSDEIERAWIEEIERRKKSLESGDTTLHSASDVVNEARKRIQK
ncbi:MAG: DUF2220 family protein [Balneolales bacterium]|nr:DUF2220 family protein [Balneolales bacterium]